jgi:hypothetical protein
MPAKLICTGSNTGTQLALVEKYLKMQISYLERIRKGVQKFQKRDKLAEQVVGDVTPNRLRLGQILTEGGERAVRNT